MKGDEKVDEIKVLSWIEGSNEKYIISEVPISIYVKVWVAMFEKIGFSASGMNHKNLYTESCWILFSMKKILMNYRMEPRERDELKKMSKDLENKLPLINKMYNK
jgi:hypothetical protein